MKEKKVKIINKAGLHARAAVPVVNTASKFTSLVQIIKDDTVVDAKSIMGLLMLAAACGTEIVIRANGQDEEQALQALEDLFNSGFGEE